MCLFFSWCTRILQNMILIGKKEKLEIDHIESI